MKITRVEPILVALPYEHNGPKPMRTGGAWTALETVFVRVETDAGLTGWGEAFGFSAAPVTMAALTQVVAPLCLGADPIDIPALIAGLQRKVHNMGRNGPLGFALSGIDIALWDILGQSSGQPVHKLLGGTDKQRIPAYASLLRYGAPELVARNVEAALARSYRQVKLHENTVVAVAAARQAAGPKIPLTLDVNCAWEEAEAVAMAERLAPYALDWLEEPIMPPDDFEALARLRGVARIKIAAGENIGTVVEMRRMAAMGAVDILQPSVTKIGGITEMRKAIAEGNRLGLRVAPHSPYFGPGLIATIHLIAAMREEVSCERFYCDLEASPLGDAVEARDGYMRIPTGPGLGISVDETVIERYRVA